MKKNTLLRWLSILLVAMVLFTGCVNLDTFAPGKQPETVTEAAAISEVGTYSSRDEVAEYLHRYGHLPSNYLTKKEAQDLPTGVLAAYDAIINMM